MSKPSIIERAKALLHNPSGKLTKELALVPAGLGLGKVPERLKPDAVTTGVCGFCSTGCGLRIHLKDKVAVNLSPDPQYPVNIGMACPKGWEALAPLESDDRGTEPLIRNKNGDLEPTDWTTGIQSFVREFKQIQEEHGKESVAFISTGQMVTEEMALLGAVTKFGMGILHGDGNTRQCMATAAVAYKQAFGFDAPPFTYKDFEASDVLVFIGANPCIAHPIMWERVMLNKHNPEIIVVDPRHTETAMAATEHVQIAPKSDLYLFYGLANYFIERDWLDHGFLEASTNGFAELKEHVAEYTVEYVCNEVGIHLDQFEKLAKTIHEGKRVSFWWTMGLNQSYQGVRTVQSVINLALMTGNIGRPGTGANSITGQANAMGSRIFSNTTNLLGGHDFTKVEHRQKVADILDIPVETIPDKLGIPYHKIIEGIDDGTIKGLWVVCTNPVHSWIDRHAIERILGKLDYLVVQDMYPTTETAQIADLFLPAAGWGEKEGTFINSERRIGLMKKVRKAPGQALSDFSIFRLVAHEWGCGEMFRQWSSPEEVFKILTELSVGQPCDISGIKGYQMLDQNGGIQWPLPKDQELVENQRRLFEDGQFYFPDKRAKFLIEDPAPIPEAPDADYPFFLLTGRGSAAQWHTQTRTGKSSVLRKLYSHEIYVEVNTDDAAKLGVIHEQMVRISSRRGSISARVYVTASMGVGQVFIPMHYRATNYLTRADFDPFSGQPSYKACAVKVESLISAI